MKAVAIFSVMVACALAQQHPAEVVFDANFEIGRLHDAYYSRFPTEAPVYREVPRPVQPRQQQAGLLAGHLADHLAGHQAPHRFEVPQVPQGPIKKWEGPFAHELPAGVPGAVTHTQFTAEDLAARKFLAQAHLNHIRQKIALNTEQTQA